jgi:hypothetical protein
MLMRDSFSRSLYQAFRLSSLMPTQKDTQSQIARKVNFAIQLLRETAEGCWKCRLDHLDRRSPRSARATRAALLMFEAGGFLYPFHTPGQGLVLRCLAAPGAAWI